MKVTVKKEDPGFVPTTVSITFNTATELAAFRRIVLRTVGQARYVSPHNIDYSLRQVEAEVMEVVQQSLRDHDRHEVEDDL